MQQFLKSKQKPFMKTLQRISQVGLLAIILLLTACKKDKEITVTGTVTADGAGLENVTVIAEGSIMDTATTDADGDYTIQVAKNGTLTFKKTGYATQTIDVDGNEVVDANMTLSGFAAYFNSANNEVANPSFGSNSLQPTGTLPTPATPTDSWFTTTSFIGAVNPSGTPWYSGWSFYDNLIAGNVNSDAMTLPTAVKTVTDADVAADTTWWVNDTLYKLDGFVYVESGKVLVIEEGTVVQGMAGTGVDASALVVARGGKIFAEGTASQPIIFTFDGDAGNTAATTRGQWGGLIVLGNGVLNSSPGTTQIEGIPTTETRGNYGGTDNADNSGILRYVSIRHGGSNIGADNEINGLTLGGVGSGTTIEFIEIVGNNDDGVEFFGGAPNVKFLISAFNADDAIDYDEGYVGKNQYFIVHQDGTSGAADRGGEHDGGTDPETAQPYAIPVFYNVTMVGNSGSRALTFRDNAGGKYYNSIFTGFSKGVDIEDLAAQSQDSYKQWEDGNLKIENSAFYNIGTGDTGADIFTVTVVQ